METEIESINDIAFILKDTFSPSEVRDAQPVETNKPKNKKRKKWKKDKALPATNDGNWTSGEDGLHPGKPLSSGSLGNKNWLDFMSLTDTNRYDRTSQGPFDVII